MKGVTLFLSGLIFISFLGSCKQANNTEGQEQKDSVSTAKVTLYYFHGDRRCKTCIAVGDVSMKTVDSCFVNEAKEGKVAFKDINIDLPENEKIANEFQVAGSALFISSLVDGKNVNEDLTEFAFMYAINNPDTLYDVLKEKVIQGIK